jgi:TIR domain
MSSLADLPELVGFFSYSRSDDKHAGGALSRLRARIYDELRLQLGRDVRLWQDTAAIPDGALWEDEIKRAIAESVFFIPIVTPSAVASGHCKFEFDSFLKREEALGRHNLVFPILYIRVPALESEDQRRQKGVLETIHARQYANWTKIRQYD